MVKEAGRKLRICEGKGLGKRGKGRGNWMDAKPDCLGPTEASHASHDHAFGRNYVNTDIVGWQFDKVWECYIITDVTTHLLRVRQVERGLLKCDAPGHCCCR